MTAVERYKKVRDTVTIEDTRIVFRNFEGREGQYNNAGNRNFGLLLDPATAEAMASEGWPIRQLEAREEDDAPQDWIRVKVSYKGRPPRIVMVTSKGKTPLDEDTVDALDFADIVKVDATLSPYNYDVNGNRGVTAYLQSLYVFIRTDYLDEKYDEIPYADGEDEIQLAVESGDIIDAEIVEDDYEVKAIGS